LKIELKGMVKDILLRAFKVKGTGFEFWTPIRSIQPSKSDEIGIPYRDLRKVFEIYLAFKVDRLMELSSSRTLERYYEKFIQRRINFFSNEKGLKIIVPSIEFSEIPKKKAEFLGTLLADLLSLFDGDIIVSSPIFYRVNEEGIYELLSAFYKNVADLGKKTLLAIPEVSRDLRLDIFQLFSTYYNEYDNFLFDIVCVDYNGSNPISKHSFHNMVLRLVKIIEDQLNQNILLYGINVKYSKFAQKYEKLPARDIASVFGGLDIIGPNHRRPVISRDVADILKRKGMVEKKVLDLSQYAYILIRNYLKDQEVYEEIEKVFKVKIDKIISAKNERESETMLKAYNAERLATELRNLSSIIRANEIDPKEYLLSKNAIKEDKIIIRRLNNFVSMYTTEILK